MSNTLTRQTTFPTTKAQFLSAISKYPPLASDIMRWHAGIVYKGKEAEKQLKLSPIDPANPSLREDIRNGKAAQEVLILHNLRLAVWFPQSQPNLWRRGIQMGISEDDLRQAAVMGIVKTANSYNPYIGFEFSTLAVTCMKNEVRDLVKSQTSSLKVPINEHMRVGIRTKIVMFMEKEGRKPREEEFEELKIPKATGNVILNTMSDDVKAEREKLDKRQLMIKRAQDVRSLHEPAGRDQERTLEETVGEEDKRFEQLDGKQVLEKSGLTNLQKTVLVERAKDRTLEEIGEDTNIFETPVTKEWVRQIELRAIGKIRKKRKAEEDRVNSKVVGIVKTEEVKVERNKAAEKRKKWTTNEKEELLLKAGVDKDMAKVIAGTFGVSGVMLQTLIPLLIKGGLLGFIDEKMLIVAVGIYRKKGSITSWLAKKREKLGVKETPSIKPKQEADTTVAEKKSLHELSPPEAAGNSNSRENIGNQEAIETAQLGLPSWFVQYAIRRITNAGVDVTAKRIMKMHKAHLKDELIEYELPILSEGVKNIAIFFPDDKIIKKIKRTG